MASKQPIVYFQPKKTELIGIIESQTFPGPPNYESIASGDEIESGWYLKLQEPVDVAYSPDEKPMDNDAPTKNIKVVQLIVDYDMPYKKLIINGRRVKIKGSLFSKLTGHHHARILLNINSLEVSK
jgi:hypothetical protein